MMGISDLTGRVALVTGGGSGIGAACARALAALGAHVVVTDISVASAEDVASGIEADGGRAFGRALDVTDARAVDAVVEAVVREAGGLDIAVNNAGVTVPIVPVADVPDDDWRRVTSINLDGVFYCLRAETRVMRARGGGGSIVNMSSIMGRISRFGSAPYSATKHAVIGLTKGAALDHAQDGIRINAVGPGFIRTPLIEARYTPEDEQAVSVRWPMRRMGTPDEVGQMVAWLAGDASSFVTGAYFPVDGGYLAS
jgi:NAD(P)-dependent dehydrogenase (short-subunit alcohol dehydrogenase family)